MSDDPLDETIRGRRGKEVAELKRKIAETQAKTADLRAFMADEETRQSETIRGDSSVEYLEIGGYRIPAVIDPALADDTVIFVATTEGNTPKVYVMKNAKPLSVHDIELARIAAQWKLGAARVRAAIQPEEIARRAMRPESPPFSAPRYADGRYMSLSDDGFETGTDSPQFLDSQGKPIEYAYLDDRGWPHAADGSLLDVPIVPTDALRLDREAQAVKRLAEFRKATRPDHDAMFLRGKAMSNDLFGPGVVTGEGNLIADDWDAIQNSDEYKELYRKSLMGQYEQMQETLSVVAAWLRSDLRDLGRIVKGWFKRR